MLAVHVKEAEETPGTPGQERLGRNMSEGWWRDQDISAMTGFGVNPGEFTRQTLYVRPHVEDGQISEHPSKQASLRALQMHGQALWTGYWTDWHLCSNFEILCSS